MTAQLGLGTYRCTDVERAAVMAAAHAADWIDTAPNYGRGSAEAALFRVLGDNPQVRVSTKVGFIPRPLRGTAVKDQVLDEVEAASGHSLAPEYIAWQIECSRRAMGRTPDVVFLHNPEHHCEPDQVRKRLYASFAALEEACARQAIGGYGVATWNGFSDGVFGVPLLLDLATKAGGPNHHLKAIQLPLSLVKLRAIAEAFDGSGVLAEARAAGLDVFASAPLHGGEVPKLVTSQLAELIRPGSSPAQAGLAVVASAPGVRRVLLSTDRTGHWIEAMSTVGRPPVSEAVLRRVVDVLGT
ncbi:aldo/keto reductase [Kitasatospora sp. NA04385]|uniref:aldo/keto reductase n=1 Tax=Kitasatospora sp. NA04385 TaxID=2742135 RepID=UPI00159092E0|nr:aldo/keto reductase [Kitasatospora sp. NA04385]QKW19399.1 aldo/keto reductase [Kitasatospora sp. NA04385]